jgi:hypothetical protein
MESIFNKSFFMKRKMKEKQGKFVYVQDLTPLRLSSMTTFI